MLAYSHVSISSIRFYCHSVTITINSFFFSCPTETSPKTSKKQSFQFVLKYSANGGVEKKKDGDVRSEAKGFYADSKEHMNVIKRKEKSFFIKNIFSHFICKQRLRVEKCQ